MTSWKAPDYKIKVTLAETSYKQLLAISGHTFAIELYRISRARPVFGMVMISQIDKCSKAQTQAWFDLWIDSKKSIIPLDENVQLVLIEKYEPMIQLADEKNEINNMLPVSFTGKIYKTEDNNLPVICSLASKKGERL